MSTKIKCLIVEDEPIAAEVLEDYVSQIAHLDLVATCRDALYALDILKQKQIDLIFLDIHLPKLKGIDFVKTLKQKPHIIFTTAYHQYAIEGFEVEALDYLLKPIAFSRFLQAINRIPELISDNRPLWSGPNRSNPKKDYLFFNINKKNVKILLEEILYVESLKDYVRIQCISKPFVIKHALSEMEKTLPAERFIRVHRSYIVAIEQVTAYTKEHIEIGAKEIPIGRSYKEVLKGKF